MTKSTCSPTVPGSAMPMAASRASSTAAASVASGLAAATSDVQFGCHRAQDVGQLLAVHLVGIVAAAQAVGGVVEQPDDVLDDHDHLVGRLAVAHLLVDRNARRRVEDAHGEGLGAATAVGDPELDARAALERRDASGERARRHEDVAALVVGDEPEALLLVEELDLACGHPAPRVLH